MKIVDVNVLLFAAVNENADHHVAIGVRHTLVRLFAKGRLAGEPCLSAGLRAGRPRSRGVSRGRWR